MNDFLDEYLDGDDFKQEFLENFENNPFLIYDLAIKSILMYTRVDP